MSTGQPFDENDHRPFVQWDGWAKVELLCTAHGCWWHRNVPEDAGGATLAALEILFKVEHVPTPDPCC